MNSIAENVTATSCQLPEKNWADHLLIAGLMIYAFSSTFSIAASQIGLGLAFIAFISLYRIGRASITSTSFARPYAFLVLAGILAVFRAELPVLAFLGLKTLLVAICFFLPYWSQLGDSLKNKILVTIVFSASVTACFAIYTVISGLAPGGRATGFFSMSLTFGETQAMLALLILGLLCHSHSLKSQLILLAAFILTSSAVFLSLQRGVWIGYLGGAAYLGSRKYKRVFAAAITLLAVLAPVAYHHEAFHKRLLGFDYKKTLELYESEPFSKEFDDGVFEANYLRPTTWTRGFQMIRSSAIFGVGHKNLKHWYELLSSEQEHKKCFIFSHQHSNFMQMLAAGGFIGLTAFFFTILATLKTIGEASIDDCRKHSATAIFIAFILFGLTENAWGDEEVSMMAFFLTGMLLSSSQEKAVQA